MAIGRPSDTDLNVWFHLTVQMDQNHAADEAFQALHKLAYITLTLISLNSKTSTFSRGVLPSCFTHSTPMPGNPVPMDINVARKVKALPDVCRCCGKTRHWAKDCKRHFDVHFIDDREIQKQLKDRLAARDVTEANAEKDDEVLDS